MGLLTTARVAIDGSKFRAVNTRDKNFTRGRVERRHVQLEQSVARYLAQLDTRRPAGAIGRACGEENAFEFKQTWRLGDLGAKHALLLAGIGWGNMPAATVRAGLQSGRLARLDLLHWRGGTFTMHLLHAAGAPPGPAGRWLMQRFIDGAGRADG